MTDTLNGMLSIYADEPAGHGDIVHASFEHGVAVVDALTDQETNALRECVISLPCVAALTELAQEVLMNGLINAMPHYVAAKEAFQKDPARLSVRGMKPRFHRPHLLNEVSEIWNRATGKVGTLWVKRRKGKRPLASPTVQVAMAAAQSMGDNLQVHAWRSQIPIAEEILIRIKDINEPEKG